MVANVRREMKYSIELFVSSLKTYTTVYRRIETPKERASKISVVCIALTTYFRSHCQSARPPPSSLSSSIAFHAKFQSPPRWPVVRSWVYYTVNDWQLTFAVLRGWWKVEVICMQIPTNCNFLWNDNVDDDTVLIDWYLKRFARYIRDDRVTKHIH